MADPPAPPKARFADAVVVAAGASTRMAGVDKIAQPLLGRSLLEWSVDAMARASSVDRIVIVTRAENVAQLEAGEWLRGVAGDRVMVVAGGEQRSDSVRAGVAATRAEIVLVHDAARPLASPALADAVAAAALRHGAAVPVMPIVDSVKRASGDLLDEPIERDGLVRTQTPQGARRNLLLDAFAATGAAAFSDEAALLQGRGVPVATVPGEAANIKVTEPDDLELVRAIARGRDGARFGLGQDTHGFGPDDGLWLGGVLIEGAPRLYGHSDGDVVLHALASAVLSATGMGDLGRLFPASDRDTKGIASSVLLGEAIAQIAAQGWAVAHAQVSLIGARPRLGGRRLEEIRMRIADLLWLDAGDVAIVASTGNLNGAEGAGRAISATALVGVHRR